MYLVQISRSVRFFLSKRFCKIFYGADNPKRMSPAWCFNRCVTETRYKWHCESAPKPGRRRLRVAFCLKQLSSPSENSARKYESKITPASLVLLTYGFGEGDAAGFGSSILKLVRTK